MEALIDAFEAAKAYKGKPTVIIASTTKGCGSAVMENKYETDKVYHRDAASRSGSQTFRVETGSSRCIDKIENQ